MSARSSLLLLLLGGCDLAFGVSGDPDPCALASFDRAKPTNITPALRFSVDWDQRFAVVVGNDGLNVEVELPSGAPRLIDLGPYNIMSLALDPEGSALLFSTATEPPMLEGALRASPGSWQPAARTPVASFTGTPSADVFGPRRMLARMHQLDETVVELEDRDGTWVAIGEEHPLVSETPPNLTPNGLTAVFSRSMVSETGTANEIYGMTRPSTDVWFGEPVKILSNGDNRAPQLLGHCERLYTIHEGNTLTRYDR